MTDRTAFDIWCLVQPDYRQIAKRYMCGTRPDLTKVEIGETINTHINARKPLLIARGKKYRFWVSMTKTQPPWAIELHLYQEGFGPETGDTVTCAEHTYHHDANAGCQICADTHKK